jgi:DEP domain-containing protein 5
VSIVVDNNKTKHNSGAELNDWHNKKQTQKKQTALQKKIINTTFFHTQIFFVVLLFLSTTALSLSLSLSDLLEIKFRRNQLRLVDWCEGGDTLFSIYPKVMADSQTYSLYVHSKTHATHDVILNPDVFPDIKVNDYVQIFESEDTDQKLTLRVSSLDAKGGRLEISILKSIADAFNLVSYVKVYVQVIDSKSARTDFVELAFRNKFVQRGDMTRYKKSMIGKAVHINQNIDLEGVNMLAQEICYQEKQLKCGVITENTNIVFRSRSARVFWLVQISAEMWDVDKSGDLYFEVFLNRFVEPIIDKWKQLGVTHSLSIIFFARTYYYNSSVFVNGGNPKGKQKQENEEESPMNAAKCITSIDQDISYQDFYKIVLDNCVYTDKTAFIRSMKEEFWNFPRILKWHVGKHKFNSQEFQIPKNTSQDQSVSSPEYKNDNDGGIVNDATDSFYAIPSGSSGGNVLEALNTTLNVLDKHFMDRDLERTGNSIVMISPGVGFFEVDTKLARITKQRMMDNGESCCLQGGAVAYWEVVCCLFAWYMYISGFVSICFY